jgi:predicted N-acetyltransferase YhbS
MIPVGEEVEMVLGDPKFFGRFGLAMVTAQEFVQQHPWLVSWLHVGRPVVLGGT